MKKFACLVYFFLVIDMPLQAQYVKDYFDRDDNPSEIDKSYYFTSGKKKSILKPGEVSKWLYVDTVFSYYSKNNVIRSREVYSNEGVLHGASLFYHENGIIRERGVYSNGKRVGLFTSYYRDGKVKMLRRYFEHPGTICKWPVLDYQLILYNDSLGKTLINNGEGQCICQLDESRNVEMGRVRNGVRDSLWRMVRNDTLILEEEYKYSHLVSGKRYDHGETVNYNEFETMPSYTGSMEALYMEIGKVIKYPPDARKKGIQGTVFVGFIIEPDGTTTGHYVVRGVHPLLDKEAVRTIKLMNKWIPGMQRGMKVRVKYALPLKFKLAD